MAYGTMDVAVCVAMVGFCDTRVGGMLPGSYGAVSTFAAGHVDILVFDVVMGVLVLTDGTVVEWRLVATFRSWLLFGVGMVLVEECGDFASRWRRCFEFGVAACNRCVRPGISWSWPGEGDMRSDAFGVAPRDESHVLIASSSLMRAGSMAREHCAGYVLI